MKRQEAIKKVIKMEMEFMLNDKHEFAVNTVLRGYKAPRNWTNKELEEYLNEWDTRATVKGRGKQLKKESL